MLLGIDIGGTFTDTVLLDRSVGKLYKEKVLSTPGDYLQCFLNGIAKVCEAGHTKTNKLKYIGHGSTVSTNAVVAREGAKMALITTKGFKDVLVIGKTKRDNLFNLYYRKPISLIPRRLIFEVEERMSSNGKEELELNKLQLKEILKKIPEEIECICVAFFNSYANFLHEKEAEEIIKKEKPHIYSSCSYKIYPIYREYSRVSTTVLNGYVTPPTVRYLNEVEKLKEKGYPLPFIVTGNGGVSTIKEVKEKSATTFLSGPAAGVVGATYLGELIGCNNIITFDMGGTSCDVALIDNGKPVFVRENYIEGYPLLFSSIGIHTIASGGGSIGWVDKGNILHIGPHSAGAVPGPVCYCRGGNEPTITDANLVLGRYPENILEGRMKLDKKKAIKVIDNKIAKPLGVDVISAAEGMIEIVNAKMIDAIRLVSIQKGYNPIDFSLLAMGGAGPSHISFMMDELNISTAICSPYSSVFCALGILVAPLRYESVETKMIKDPISQKNVIFDILERLKSDGIKRLANSKCDFKSIEFEMFIDVRYKGQKFETSIPVYEQDLKENNIESIIKRFHTVHQKKYTYSQPNIDVEFVNYRVVSIGNMFKIKLEEIKKRNISLTEARKGERKVIFDKKEVLSPVYCGEKIEPGHKIKGPAIIEYFDTTVVIPPSKEAKIDNYGNIVIGRLKQND